VRLLVRSWNVFHGNAHPARRKGFLRTMIELASGDGPDVLCLQEVPVWAITRPPLWLGPISTWVTRLNQGLFRSGLAGQANAILVACRHVVTDLGHERISDDGRERRLVQAVRLEDAGVVVGNLHASNEFRDPSVPRAEADRARAFVELLARPGEPVVLAGDFNLRDPGMVGYSPPWEGIDHILVRGAPAGPLTAWAVARRTRDGIVLSDHAPVECALELEAR
jgi:endonuclease/exonuclease/phosphatase family metal-dependent hydrolase